MNRIIRNLALPVLLGAALAANAQTPSQAAAAGGNPAARGERHSFFFSAQRSPSALQNGSEAIKRPTSQFGPVTPVPEPSEWAMLVAGLAFVGWVIRRKTRQ
jgi:hypothetical protein